MRVLFISMVFGLFLTPGFMYVLALIEGKWRFRLSDEFSSFMPGDIFLGIGFGFGCALFSYIQPGHVVPGWWSWVALSAGVLAPIALSVPEVIGSFSYQEGDKDKYHWRQMISPRKIWHNVVVYGLYSYLWVNICMPALVLAPSAVRNLLTGQAVVGFSAAMDLTRVTVVGFVGLWVKCLIRDANSPKCDTAHARVDATQLILGTLAIALVLRWIAAVA